MPDDLSLTTVPVDTTNPTTSHIEEAFVSVDHVRYSYAGMIAACEPKPESIDLAVRFREALKKLEGLLYAAMGSVPKSYEDDEQWWLNDHPRCNFPEQTFCDFDGPDKRCEYSQTAAFGRVHGLKRDQTSRIDTGYFDWSRSDTLGRQWRRTRHTAYCPIGAVAATWANGEYNDPPSAAPITFAYTPPPGLASAVTGVTIWINGSSHAMGDVAGVWTYELAGQPNNQQVLFWLQLSVTEAGEAKTYYEPYGDDAVSAPTAANIPTDVAGEQPGQNHNHQEAGSCYYLYVLDHRHDYAHGLPELVWEDYTGEKRESLKRCTGTWAFTDWSNISPGLINLARFSIDYLGDRFQHDPDLRGPSPRCCFNHNIKFRWTGGNKPWLYREGGKGSAPIEYLTDATGKYLTDDEGNWLIVDRIPGREHTVYPLTNLHIEPDGGSVEARKTWRGMPGVYHRENNMAVPYVDGRDHYIAALDYGNDESWLSWPRADSYTHRDILTPSNPRPDLDEWYPGVFGDHGQRRGLRAGDQIDKIHLLEIVEAVDYLMQYGLWSVVPTKICKRTPTTCSPWDTQQLEFSWNGSAVIPDQHTRDVEYPSMYDWYDAPLDPNSPIESYYFSDELIGQPCFGGCYYQKQVCHHEGEYGDIVIDTPAIPWDAPATVAECRSGTSGERHIAEGFCPLAIDWYASCDLDDDLNCDSAYVHRECYSPGYMHTAGMFGYGLFPHMRNDPVNNQIVKNCYQDQEGQSHNSNFNGSTHGWSYYLCGVDQAYLGPTWGWWNDDRATPKWSTFDALHGNGIAKVRYGGGLDWAESCNQYLASMGNRFDAAKRCKVVTSAYDFAALPVAFDAVTEVEFSGPATPWAVPRWTHDCQLSTDIEDEIPPIPGLGYWNVAGLDGVRQPMCTYYESEGYPEFQPPTMYNQQYNCTMTFPALNNCEPQNDTHVNVYARVDLNKNALGVPQLYDYELNTHMLDADGDPLQYPSGPALTRPDYVYDEDAANCYLTAGGVTNPYRANDGLPA